jgi:hypothetical protein
MNPYHPLSHPVIFDEPEHVDCRLGQFNPLGKKVFFERWGGCFGGGEDFVRSNNGNNGLKRIWLLAKTDYL